MTERVKVLIDEETLDKLAELERSLPNPGKERADNLRMFLNVWTYMHMVADDKLPIHATLDRLHVLNDAALAKLTASADLSGAELSEREQQLLEQKDRQAASIARQKAGELYDALQLKPSFFGFGVDLKALFSMFKGKPKK